MMAETDKSPKPKANPKWTDAERHMRFVQMAHEVEAATDEKDFEKAFSGVVRVDAPKT